MVTPLQSGQIGRAVISRSIAFQIRSVIPENVFEFEHSQSGGFPKASKFLFEALSFLIAVSPSFMFLRSHLVEEFLLDSASLAFWVSLLDEGKLCL